MKRIVQKDNEILRKVAKNVPQKDLESNKFKKIIDEMIMALDGESDGVALAAPQIAESWRIFVVSPIAYEAIKYKGERNFIFVNPKIIKKSADRKLMEEGCLSVRPWYGKVRRSSRVTIEALNENGQKFTMEGSGLLAQIFQHETDHLNGVLFIDKAKDLKEIPVEKYEGKK